MKNLVKIGVTRLYKNIFFIVGCVLAFLITEWFVSVGPIPQLAKYGATTNAIVVSAGIIFFFALFTGMFFGGERESGILRNQVMAGYSQKEIFFGRYITLLIALTVMNLFWILGAVVGGTKIDAQMLKYIGIEFLYNAAAITVVLAICSRTKKQLNGIVISLGIAYLCVTGVLVGNFIYSITADISKTVSMIVAYIYNLSPVGQCFARSGIADEGIDTLWIQLLASLTVLVLGFFFGTFKVSKSDVN